MSVHLIKEGTLSEVARLPYAVKGADLEFALPRSLFGPASKLAFDFKWADNQQKDGEMVEFAIHGDSAPDRRFNFRYDGSVTEEQIRVWADAASLARKRP